MCGFGLLYIHAIAYNLIRQLHLQFRGCTVSLFLFTSSDRARRVTQGRAAKGGTGVNITSAEPLGFVCLKCEVIIWLALGLVHSNSHRRCKAYSLAIVLRKARDSLAISLAIVAQKSCSNHAMISQWSRNSIAQ